MGAQNPARLRHYLQTYEMMCEMQKEVELSAPDFNGLSDQIPPYFYGTHYSTPLACVLHFLVRTEPFTQLHVTLQDNHFDVSDRLFFDADVTCHCCLENLPEVKELIPEWYSDVSFLRNANRQGFGARQNGAEVDDVAIAGSAAQFVSRNLQALEDAHTSAFLQRWVDLVFGCKQQGQPAVEACNVFYYLTYPQNCDLTGIEDEGLKQAIVTQAANFGQCPAVLFSASHPGKALEATVRDLRSVLLATPADSIYEATPAQWLGARCVVTAVSDWEPGALLASYSEVQRVLGHSPADADVHHRLLSHNAESLPLVTAAAPRIAWPAHCAFPWSVTVDSCDWLEMRRVKVVLDDRGADSFNVKAGCCDVKTLSADGNWHSVVVSQSAVRTPEGIVVMLSLAPTRCRFWRVEILELPFQRAWVAPCLQTRNAQKECSLPGPVVTCIDVMGRMAFPLAPPPPRDLGTLPPSCPQCALWWARAMRVKRRGPNMAAVTAEKELLLFSLENPSERVLLPLSDVLAPYTLLAVHPKVGAPTRDDD